MDYDYFPVSMSAVSADIDIIEMSQETIGIGPVTVNWEEQIFHPGGSVRYRLNVNDKKIVYATDVELDRVFNDESTEGKNENAGRDYLAFIKDADLLIADGQYTDEEYVNKAGWGHTSISTLIDAAHQSHVKQLAVFHHDPQHSDRFIDELWMEKRPGFHIETNKMDVFWAREGMTLAV
jgi:ribonuclease BN (tRNA processing enzyme)